MDRERRLEAEAPHVELSIMLSICSVAMPCVFAPQRVHGHGAIIGRDWFHPFAVMGGEILAPEPAADAAEIGVDRAGDLALIKTSRPPPAIIR